MGARSRWFLCLYWLVAGCGGDRAVAPPTDEPTGENRDTTTTAGRELAFPDSGLAAAIRAALGQSTGPVTAGRVLTITELDASDRGIADLRGINELARLRVLVLRNNRIADLTPLAGLSRLAFLDLENNQVSDLAPLAALDSLQALIADYNRISDPSPLLGLPSLRSVELVGNPIPAAVLRQFQAALSDVSVTGPDTTAANTTGSTTAATGPGTPVAFFSSRNQCNGVYLVEFDGQRPGATRLLTESDGWTPFGMSWAPDAASLILSLFVEARSNTDLYLLSGDGTLTRLTTFLGADSAPIWSPDGEWLAWCSAVQDDPELWISKVDGGETRRLTYSPGSDYPGSWSPDGRWIAFTSARSGNDDIWLIQPDGTGAFPLTDDPAIDTQPVWSPDGQWLAFTSDRDGDFDIWVMRADGTQARNLTDYPAMDHSPTWSPDGQWLALASDRDQGDQEIYVVPATGGTAINLSNHPGRDWGPSWAPAPVTGFPAPSSPDFVVFADPDLERGVRRAIGASSRDLTPQDLLAITSLDLSNRSISDLTGIERLSNLENLILGNSTTYIERDGRFVPDSSSALFPFSEWNQVHDLSPLADLTRLERLELGLNPIESLEPLAGLIHLARLTVGPISTGDLSPLRFLTRMQRLSISGSAVEDLEPLAGMTDLFMLTVTDGRVRDLAPLTGLTRLIVLTVSDNRIEDLRPLAGLPRLGRLYLNRNQIRDIEPLLGLTALTDLTLIGNPLDQESLEVHLPALRARGVQVGY